MKIILNPDKTQVHHVRNALKETGGYCPCRIEKSDETKCICKDFLDQKEPGLCHCGLYKKVER